MALILENVGKTFENTGRATLKNINLEIQPGELLGKADVVKVHCLT